MKSWQKALVEEWQTRNLAAKRAQTAFYPLVEQHFDSDEILAMTDVLLSGQLTMAARVTDFEKRFAEYVGVPFAVMANSGSSANLLAMAVATNPMRSKQLKAGDEVLIPAVCWSTSIWPVLQMGLKPVLVDVDPCTLNIDLAAMKKRCTSLTRGFVAVHVLGNCAPMDEVLSFARERELVVIEDTCESLGVKWRGKMLGSLGDMGTYSFYFSHHMTTGEGGMVVCKTLEDYDLLKCLRAHGWTRELSNRMAIEAKHPDVDSRFAFVNVGYNLRPMEIQAALGLKQIEKLSEMNRCRMENWHALVEALRSHSKWQEQLEFPHAPAGVEPVWFGFPAIFSDKVKFKVRSYLEELSKRGVENRPIISGNFARQPGLKLVGINLDVAEFPGAERLHHRGFFIGMHSQKMAVERIRDLADRLLAPF